MVENDDEVSAEELSKVFSALADATRRDMVTRLAEGDSTLRALADRYAISMQAVAKHLKVLEDAGLISRTKQAQRRPIHLEVGAFVPMAAWVERYRRRAEGRFRRLDELLAAMPDDDRRSPSRRMKGP